MKAFSRITLKPGEKKTVQLKVNAADLCYQVEGTHRYVLEADQLNVMRGTSSADVKFSEVASVLKQPQTKF